MRAKKRLREIAMLVENQNCVADIGCDHGQLTKILIEEKRAKKVIATDISADSLDKTIRLAKQFGFEQNISARVGNGLLPIVENEVETAIIAGIGGQEIIKILATQSHKNIRKFIFAPAQNAPELRKYLSENGFEILYDNVIKDHKKYYHTIKAEKTSQNKKLQKVQILFGIHAQNCKNGDFFDFLCDFAEKRKLLISKNIKTEKIQEELNLALGLINKFK